MCLSGLSLKSQELTAMFLAARMFCSTIMEGDIHTLLDLTTFLSTLWVIYMIRFKLKLSYIKELDNLPLYYVVIKYLLPCFLTIGRLREYFSLKHLKLFYCVCGRVQECVLNWQFITFSFLPFSHNRLFLLLSLPFLSTLIQYIFL